MGTLKLPYVVTVRAKGKDYLYFRKGKTYKRLPPLEHKDFHARYEQLCKKDAPRTAPSLPGSFGDLCDNYITSSAYRNLAKSTQKEFRRHVDMLKGDWTDLPPKSITRAAVLEYRESLSKHPRKADYSIQVLRRILNWGIDRGMLKVNPAARPGRFKTARGNQPWSDADIAAYRTANAKNDMMLLTLTLGLATGQRRGDLIKMTRADYNGSEIAVLQNKTGEKVWVPVHPTLKGDLDGIKRFMLLQSERGKAFTARHLSNHFLSATRHANLNGLTLHGLRVTAAIWMAEAGCTDAELQAILGWRTVAQAQAYRKQANKRAMAASGMKKLERLRPKV